MFWARCDCDRGLVDFPGIVQSSPIKHERSSKFVRNEAVLFHISRGLSSWLPWLRDITIATRDSPSPKLDHLASSASMQRCSELPGADIPGAIARVSIGSFASRPSRELASMEAYPANGRGFTFNFDKPANSGDNLTHRYSARRRVTAEGPAT